LKIFDCPDVSVTMKRCNNVPELLDLFAVGRVVRPQGRRGELRVRPLTDHLPTLLQAKEVWLGPATEGGAASPVEVEGARLHQGRIPVLKLSGIDDMDGAEALRGRELCLPRGQLQPLAKDEYFIHDLVGLAVLGPAGEKLGRVTSVMETSGHPNLVVEGSKGELLVPFAAATVGEVDLAGGTVRLLPFPG
jgi:16S rRNA processing protein RimM